MRNPWEVASIARPTRRMMVFVDGENLVCRYQAMVKDGYVCRDDICYERDVYVWHRGFTNLGAHHEILRVTYYTYATGDDNRITLIRKKLQQLEFETHVASMLPNFLSPCIFKKENRAKRAKGVDIKLSVDVLSHVFRGNVDSILLLTGDGDYGPLIDEVRRAGVLVYVSAFSNGFSSSLKERADAIYELDGTTWA